MSSPNETDALIELLIQLKKIVGTVPDQAKVLLTSQPSLAYSLIRLMVKMNILNAEALQKTLSALANPQPPSLPPPQPGPLPGLSQPAPVSNGHSQNVAGYPNYAPPQPQYQPPAPTPHSVPQSYIPPAPTPPVLPQNTQAMLAAIPEDQRNMVLQILSYTPEQISQLAPTDRATFIQLRATFGVGS
ncbi:hypothetical protein BU17DRAFT_93171 [Hysterangium stoloniferum]|nr:hypothetical protein BU17DRAFT_93171 [Hysterangium stoloniferum]